METYDFFISYKWSTYAREAEALRDIARSRGFTVWIDKEHFSQTQNQSDAALAEHLKNTMNSCRYVLFFETHATMAAQVGGPDIRVTSWQERELGMATSRKLITLYHGATPRSIGFGTSPNLHPYEDLDDAMTMIQSAVANTSSKLWK